MDAQIHDKVMHVITNQLIASGSYDANAVVDTLLECARTQLKASVSARLISSDDAFYKARKVFTVDDVQHEAVCSQLLSKGGPGGPNRPASRLRIVQ